MDIRTALTQLDPANDAQWTDDGLPSVEAVTIISGMPSGSLTRQQILDVAPEFTRANPRLDPSPETTTEAEDAVTPDPPEADAQAPATTPEPPDPGSESNEALQESDPDSVDRAAGGDVPQPSDVHAVEPAQTAERDLAAEKAARIRGALEILSADDDEHWSPHGYGDADVVSSILSENVTADEIDKAAPGYKRWDRKMPAGGVTKAVASDAVHDTPLARALAEQRRTGAQRHRELADLIGNLTQEKQVLEGRIAEALAEQARYQAFAENPLEYDHLKDQEARMAYIQADNARRLSAAPGRAVSPLDKAMSARKPARGAARPSFPPPRSVEAP